MDMNGLAELVRASFEPLQYAAFFGALLLLGGLEAMLPLAGADAGAGDGRARRWPANGALTVLNILVLGALPVSVLAAADFAAARGWGLLNQDVVPPLAALPLGFVLRSLVGYFIHVAMHKVPLLWRVHKVHHTDTALDVSTTVRFHPLEFLISLPILLAATAALGLPPLAVILFELVDAATAVFTHANLRLGERTDRALRLVLVTPAMHRIHHSSLQPETDSNYGALFSSWDRLFGTYRPQARGGLAAMQLGLEDARGRQAHALGWLLALPFHAARRRPAAAGEPA